MFLIDLAILAACLHLFDWFTRVNWTNLVVLEKWLALSIEVPVSYALLLTKGRYAALPFYLLGLTCLT